MWSKNLCFKANYQEEFYSAGSEQQLQQSEISMASLSHVARLMSDLPTLNGIFNDVSISLGSLHPIATIIRAGQLGPS